MHVWAECQRYFTDTDAGLGLIPYFTVPSHTLHFLQSPNFQTWGPPFEQLPDSD